MSKEVLSDTSEQTKISKYSGASVEYAVLESASDHRPILIVPGFIEGRLVLQNFATALHDLGDRKVIFSDQPEIKGEKGRKLSVVDHHAEAMLSIVEAEELKDQPVDILTHSLGSLIAARMAELAKERGIHCFDSEIGSHSIFIAPAGSNSGENLVYLASRVGKFMAKSVPYGKELDPTGEMTKAGVKNFFRRPAKTIKEVIALSKKERTYKALGATGLKPFVFGYAADDLYPHRVVESVMRQNEDGLQGYAVPIDNSGVGAGSFSEFKTKTGLEGRAAKKAWAHHYRSAGHNDFLFHPERTAKAVLQVIEQ